MAPRGDAGLRLIQSGWKGSGANAFILLYIIAQRCRYADKDDGLQPGQCFISTHEKPLSNRQTRTAIDILKKTGQITTKSTNKGTTVTLISTDIFDVFGKKLTRKPTSKETSNQQANDQQTNKQTTTNKEGNKVSNKGNKRESKARASLSEVIEYAISRGLPGSDGEHFFNSQEAGGWTRNGNPLKDWRAAFRTWQSGEYFPSQQKSAQATIGSSYGKAGAF